MQQEPFEVYTKISDHIRSHNLLQTVCLRLKKEFGLIPCVGVEIEFYLTCEAETTTLKQEKGNHQYEIDLPPETDMLFLVQKIEQSKRDLVDIYPDINFHPKPFLDDYGSAMHFHINFLYKDGSNYFDDAQKMDHAASALCHYLLPTFFLFAPDASHYTRYLGMMAPTNVSYGSNNRTVAIRVPDAKPRRLEHRVSSPMTDSHVAIFAILQSIYLALTNPSKIKRYEKIYGNAFDEQYALEALPRSVEKALQCYDMSALIS